MGFLQNVVGGAVNTVKSIGGGVVSGVSNLLNAGTGVATGLISSVTPAIGTIVNSPAGTVAAGSLLNLTGGGGSSVSSALNMFNSKSGEAPSTASFMQKLFNFYKLKNDTLIVKTAGGSPELNYELDANGKKVLNVPKVIGAVVLVFTLGFGGYKLFSGKKGKKW